MICERCKKYEATVHLSEVIKHIRTEIHLCEICAKDIGLHAKLSDFTLTLPDMLSFLDINEIRDKPNVPQCAVCGTSFIEYRNSGRVGCPFCFDDFYNGLYSSISAFHGATKHCGKNPKNTVCVKNKKSEKATINKINQRHKIPEDIHELEKCLLKAVNEERYEDAAHIRDIIRSKQNVKPSGMQ